MYIFVFSLITLCFYKINFICLTLSKNFFTLPFYLTKSNLFFFVLNNKNIININLINTYYYDEKFLELKNIIFFFKFNLIFTYINNLCNTTSVYYWALNYL